MINLYCGCFIQENKHVYPFDSFKGGLSLQINNVHTLYFIATKYL